ncbi:hypothetical protein [Nocardia noduli]|uniref:hypothetical protein n=1 Tax=Nocardia noduli TaxID=2815722 RepID=UPI001C24878B|nr:hypothetical protein [Nocardia noduli]
MTDTLIDVPVGREQIARPDICPPPVPARRAHSGIATPWRDAKTVLVARSTGPTEMVTVPRLVVPIGEKQLAFGVASLSAEADQFAHDNRVVVQQGDWRGNPALGTHQLQGEAQLVTAGTLLPYVQSELEMKYRWRIPLARLVRKLVRGDAVDGDLVVLVTVHEPSPVPLLPS